MGFALWLTVDHHRLSALAMTSCGGNDMGGSVTTRSLSLRGKSEASDAAIHRLLADVDGFVSSVIATQWIATSFQPS